MSRVKLFIKYSLSPLMLFACQAWHKLPLAGKPGFGALIFHHLKPENESQFEKLLDYLLRKYEIISPQDAEAILQGTATHNRSKRPFLLTFDDGFHSHAAIAARVMNKYRVKGIFFVCPGLLSGSREEQKANIASRIFDGSLAPSQIPSDMDLMSWADLQGLTLAGHTVGIHGMSHRRLKSIPDDACHEEIVGSKELMAQKMGTRTDWFAFPFGDVRSIDERSLKVIFENYTYCCSGVRGFNASGSRVPWILRDHIDLEAPFTYQQLILEGGLHRFYRAKVRLLSRMSVSALEKVKNVSSDVKHKKD